MRIQGVVLSDDVRHHQCLHCSRNHGKHQNVHQKMALDQNICLLLHLMPMSQYHGYRLLMFLIIGQNTEAKSKSPSLKF